MLELVRKTFAQELLSVSHKADYITDFIWMVHRAGGSVPLSLLLVHFPKAEHLVDSLSKAGLMRYSMGGFVNNEQKKESLAVFLDEDIIKSIPNGLERSEFAKALHRRSGDKIIPLCAEGLIEPLSAMLTSIIFYATPEKGVFAGKVLRKTSKMTMRTYVECKDIMDYYLERYLGLIATETGSIVNFSVRAKQRLRLQQNLWDVYCRTYVEKEDEPKTEMKKRQGPEQIFERRLKGYFPWMKL